VIGLPEDLPLKTPDFIKGQSDSTRGLVPGFPVLRLSISVAKSSAAMGTPGAD
jgi:hypothetical protein